MVAEGEIGDDLKKSIFIKLIICFVFQCGEIFEGFLPNTWWKSPRKEGAGRGRDGAEGG